MSESWCRVSSPSSISTSIASSEPMACSIECVGNSCMVIATSPKARSRSTRQTRRAPFSVSASARLTEIVVLPTPPLGEKTAITLLDVHRAGGAAQGHEQLEGPVRAPR